MIVQLTGTLVEVLPSRVVIDVGGVGYELGVSSTTAASLPHAGEAGVTVLTRMIVREDAMELYGFATREERALFDQLRAISGVGPKLALAVLSTFTASQLATVVATEDAARMAQVPGVGKKKGLWGSPPRGPARSRSQEPPRRRPPAWTPRRRRPFFPWGSLPRRRSSPWRGARSPARSPSRPRSPMRLGAWGVVDNVGGIR